MDESKWISVKDRVPESNGEYLTFGFWHEYFIAEFVTNEDHSINSWSVQGVTHWMLLPAAPLEV